MGIHDREYARQSSGGFRGSSQHKKWSVTTWLIVICVGIFVIDEFLPASWVPVERISVVDPMQFPEESVQVSYVILAVNKQGIAIQRKYEGNSGWSCYK